MRPVRSSFSLAGFLVALWLILATGAYFVIHKPLGAATGLRLVLTARDCAAAALLMAAAGGLGRRLLPSLALRPAARMAVQGALGLGALGLVQLGLGALAGVSAPIAWAGLLGLLAVFRREARAWLRDAGDVVTIARAGGRFGALVALLAALGLGTAFLHAALPPVAYDALVYHLALPRAYLGLGRIALIPETAFWGMPQTGEMLYTWALALTGSEPAAGLLGWAVGVLAIAGVLGWTAQLLGARAGWAAVAALLAGATTLSSLGWAYVDWFAALFGFGCLALLGSGTGRPHPGWAGLLAGFALGSKYTAGVILLCGLAALLLGENPYASVSAYLERAGRAVRFGLAAAAGFGPWLLKNALAVRNPFYPFIYPAGPVTADRLAWYAGQPAWGTWMDAVFLPWQAAMTGLEGAPGYSASVGPLLLVLAVLGWLGWRTLGENGRRGLRCAAVVSVAGLIVWAAAGRVSGLLIQTRLYFVLFPAFAVLAGAGFRGLAEFDWPGVRLGRIAAILCTFVLGLNVFQVGARALEERAPAAFLGLVSTETYTIENLGMYHLAAAAAAGLPEDARVLMLYEPRGLACALRCDPDEFLDRWPADAQAHRRDPARILAAWVEAGYTHLLYHRTGAEFFRDDPRFPPDDWLALNAVITGLEPVVNLDDVYILLELP